MVVTYMSIKYAPQFIVARYVRRDRLSAGLYRWCEVGADRMDWRQGTVTADELPDAVRALADGQTSYPSYVSWPTD
jgi:hypothetical protein